MSKQLPDFNNTENAFRHLSNNELKKAKWLFTLFNNPFLVKIGSALSLWGIKYKIPGAEWMIKKTIYDQFCAGNSLLDSKDNIEKLWEQKVMTILDYGAEAKESEEDFNFTMNQTIRSIEFAAQQRSIPVVSTKITGIARMELLEKMNKKELITTSEKEEFEIVIKRIDSICYSGHKHNIGIYIDAEESWIQDVIDQIADMMMARYNQEKVVVFNTVQMYRWDRLEFLKRSIQKARNSGYKLGMKVVRGAYIEKENKRAEEMDYPTPIQPNKESTDKDYDLAINLCVEHIDWVSCCCATHNMSSTLDYVSQLYEHGIATNHEHVMCSQLYGMSDNITFNLAQAGINTSKYVPYGPVHDVIPYLVRRAQENSSVTGEMGRELQLLSKEVTRRSKLTS